MDMREAERFVPVPGQRVAVIGGGISGLAAAWLLCRDYRVTLFEADARAGGHTHTVPVELDGQVALVDTGFLVFNRQTYPELCRLFETLGIASTASEMSFSVSLREPRIEWAGTSLATVFGQPRNLLRPGFWRMLNDILRFNRETLSMADDAPAAAMPLGAYLDAHGYSQSFRDWYLLPMAAAIWSCPTRSMAAYPLGTFVRFCRNHGLLQITDRPQWLTVMGGGQTYVNRMLQDLPDVRLGQPVSAIARSAHGVTLRTPDADEVFDAVIMACHSDQALRILGEAASEAEQAILGAVRYQPNVAWLHTDTALLPERRHLWAAWNYMAGDGAPGDQPVSVSYLLNRLQPLPFDTPLMVTLNPPRPPAQAHVLKRIEYAHPVFDQGAIDAQGRLAALQGERRTWFAGAWTGYGFHEDGLRSALAVATRFGVMAPWHAPATAVAA